MDCAVTLCNTILINRVIRVIRALKNLFYSVIEKTQRSEQSCRKQRFLCPAIFCISPNAIKRCFSFISSCQCIRPSICNFYFKLISSFFQGTCNICTIRSSPDCATIYSYSHEQLPNYKLFPDSDKSVGLYSVYFSSGKWSYRSLSPNSNVSVRPILGSSRRVLVV